MARLWSSGFELNSLATGVEISSKTGLGSATIDTATVKGGIYSLKCSTSANTTDVAYVFSSSGVNKTYIRIYVRIATSVSVTCALVDIFDQLGDNTFRITLNTNNTLQPLDAIGGVNIGLPSIALNNNQWYRLELFIDMTTPSSAVFTCKLDGTQFSTSTVDQTGENGTGELDIGLMDVNTTGVVYFDDIAINDDTGSFQNSYPGDGVILHLKPNAAGDNNGFATQVGGTAGASNNYTRVNEVPPDDATSYNADSVGTHVDDFNIDAPSAINALDTVNLVQIGVRYSALVASLESGLKVRCKKTTGGTISKSAEITPTSTSWTSNANAAPFNYPLTLYQDPDSSAWTTSTLNTAQIGYEISTGNTNATAVSTLWMLVDYTPTPRVVDNEPNNYGSWSSGIQIRT